MARPARRTRRTSRPSAGTSLFEAARLEARLLLANHPLTSIPALDSYASAYAQIYLDFNGEPAHTWAGKSVPVTPAFTEDADATTFSDQELADIQEIWARVAEKFSPFNVNVTTVRPSDFNQKHALHLIIGGDGLWAGGEVGGISSVGCFYSSAGTNSYVFSAILSRPEYAGVNKPKYIAETAAHEAGHAFSLNHQSTYSGSTMTNAYNPGDALRAPIMGSSYGAARGLWWIGPSQLASTDIQDDLVRLDNPTFVFDYRPDDRGNTPATASPLAAAGSTLTGAGVIEQTTDADYFSFTTPAGTASFTVNVAPSGPMLDARVEIRDAGNNVVASADTASLGETISASLPAGTYYLVVKSHGGYGDIGQYSISGTISQNSLRVTAFTPTSSGFDVQLNRPANLTQLNVYTTESAAQAADVTLVGTTVGTVHGSLVWDPATYTAHFVKTGGPLLPDTYTATLAGRADGWVDALGNPLDGNADGNPGGNYVANFTVAASAARVVSLGDFARGPGQPVNLPATGTGLPIRISDGSSVSSVQLMLSYDASMLTISSVAGPTGWTVSTTGSTPGQLLVSASGPALSGGVASLLTLSASVPGSAQYGAAELLRISGLQINGGAIAATADDAIHKATFLGDATGDRSYSSLDAADTSRVVVGLDTGFATVPLADPVIIGDVTGDGTLSGLDAMNIALEAVLLPVPGIPDLPANSGLASAMSNGSANGGSSGVSIASVLTVTQGGNQTGARGASVNVPLAISDDAFGLASADLTITYNTSLLNLANADVVLDPAFAAGGWVLTKNVNDATGVVRLSLYSTTDPITQHGPATLVTLVFHVPADAMAGTSPITIDTSIDPNTGAARSRLNEGQLSLASVAGSIRVPIATSIIGSPASGPEGTPISLSSSVSGQTGGVAYSWSVTKNGSAYSVSGNAAAGFTFTPDDNGNYVVSLATTDVSGNTGAASTTITVTNLAPAPTLSGLPAGNAVPEETPISLGVDPHDPGTLDTFTYAWTVTRSGITFATAATRNFSFTPDAPGVYDVQITVTDNGSATGNASASITATHLSYRVANFAPTSSGFDVQLVRPANLGLLNLYTTETAAQSPDVTLVGATVGAVHGSLVWDPTTCTAHFVKTGGPLLPDTYTATLVSQADGWVDTRGEQLDGDADGSPGGNYVANFTVTPSTARVVSLGDFARGPGQAVNLPAAGTGIPIRISDGNGVSSVQLALTYDPAVLTLNNVTGPTGWTVDTTGSTPGHLLVAASGPALAGGVGCLLTLNATVPGTARYGSAELLHISGLQINGGTIATMADDAVHKVAFLGDATGDRSYSALDAADISRIVVGLDTGFAAFPLADPVIVGDITGDGTLSGMDAMNVARKAVLLPVPEMPDLPVGTVPVAPSGGLDPIIAMGTGTGAPGNVVDVPVRISSAASLQGADLAVSYYTPLLDLANADVVLGSLPAGWTLVRNVDDPAGIVRMSLFNAGSLASGSGPLVDLKFHIAAAAPDTSAPVSLITSPATASRLNEGRLPLSTLPGSVVVDATRPALNVGSSVVSLTTAGLFGTLAIASGGRLNVVAGSVNPVQLASLIISPGGVLDLNDNDLVLTDLDAAGFATLHQYLGDGRIITSITEPTPGQFATLALIDNRLLHLRTWDGATISDGTNFSQVIIKHTWIGDTNLDGAVTAEDYLNIIANQGQPGQWILGDLNGDGVVTADDLAVVNSNLGAGLPATPGPQLPAIASVAAHAVVAKVAPKLATKPTNKQSIAAQKRRPTSSVKPRRQAGKPASKGPTPSV